MSWKEEIASSSIRYDKAGEAWAFPVKSLREGTEPDFLDKCPCNVKDGKGQWQSSAFPIKRPVAKSNEENDINLERTCKLEKVPIELIACGINKCISELESTNYFVFHALYFIVRDAISTDY